MSQFGSVHPPNDRMFLKAVHRYAVSMSQHSRVLVSAVTTVALAGMVSPASAATTAEIADLLLEKASEALEIEITDPELIDELTDGLEYAIEDGSISDDVVDEIDESIDSETDPDELDDDLATNIIDQILNWEEYAPEYRVLFEEVRADFQACRQAAGSASSCARGLGFNMQVAIANDSLIRLQLLEDQLTAEGVVLTDEERAALEAERAELAAKIKRAEEKLAGLDDSDPEVQAAKKEMARIRSSAVGLVGEGSSESDGDMSDGSGSDANGSSPADNPGNSGGNSGGNGIGSGNSNGNGNSGGGGNSNGGGKGKGKP